MPMLWKDLECDHQDLSDQFWQMTYRHRNALEKLHFICCGFSKIKAALKMNPVVLDEGKISYLHKNNSYVGMVLYSKSRLGGSAYRTLDRTIIVFTAVFKDRSLSVTNNKLGFDHDSNQKVIRIYRDDASFLYDEFLRALKRESEQPIVFFNQEQMRQWFDSRQIQWFEMRVERGLYVKMTDGEIEQARRKIPPPLPKAAS